MAVTVLTNGQGWAAATLEQRIVDLLLAPSEDPDGKVALQHAQNLFSGLQKGAAGSIFVNGRRASLFYEPGDRGLRRVAWAARKPSSFTETHHTNRGGFQYEALSSRPEGRGWLETYIQPDGKFAQYMVDPAPAASE